MLDEGEDTPPTTKTRDVPAEEDSGTARDDKKYRPNHAQRAKVHFFKKGFNSGGWTAVHSTLTLHIPADHSCKLQNTITPVRAGSKHIICNIYNYL